MNSNEVVFENQTKELVLPGHIFEVINKPYQSEIFKELTRRKYRQVQGYANWLELMELFTQNIYHYRANVYQIKHDAVSLQLIQSIIVL